MVEIKGLQKSSVIDYPGKMCCVVFLAGCNFRCPFCHNVDLVLNPEKLPSLPEKDFFNFLKERKGWLDAVCITGGEPCIYKDLPEFIKKIKEFGFLVKLDTNGTNPEMLEKLIQDKLIDYIAMDIKAPLNKYEAATNSKVDIEDIKKATKLLKNSSVDYEFRTTVLPRFHKKKDLVQIGEWLKGTQRYYLQQFRSGKTLDKSLENEKTYTKEELEKFAEILKSFFGKVEVRS